MFYLQKYWMKSGSDKHLYVMSGDFWQFCLRKKLFTLSSFVTVRSDIFSFKIINNEQCLVHVFTRI